MQKVFIKPGDYFSFLPFASVRPISAIRVFDNSIIEICIGLFQLGYDIPLYTINSVNLFSKYLAGSRDLH